MSDSESSINTWSSVIDEYASRLGVPDSTAPITTESDHKREFKNLCNQYKERDDERLLTRIHRQHDRLLEFLYAIDAAHRHEPSYSLSSLFWQLSIHAVHGAFLTGIKLSVLLKQTSALNHEFPAFNRELLSRFWYEPAVQKPLQDLFRKYFDLYQTMFSDPATYPSILNLSSFSDSIKDVSQLFLTCTSGWERALKAAEEEEQRRLLSASVPSSPNGALGMPMHTQNTNAHFKVIRHLGVGSYGEVSAVLEPTTKKEYAQKLIRVRDRHDLRARDRVELQVKNEVEVGQKLRHHHIASVLFYVRDPHAFVFSMIMLPVGDYDLRRFLEENCVEADYPKQELKHLDTWFGCLMSALAFAHQESIKHEDIKPSNILIKDYRPYLADFGSAKDFSEMEASTSTDLITGTPIYWPPEAPLRGRSGDVFALGCVFSEMLTVRQRRSLTDYRAFRQVKEDYYGLAFRKNLPGVSRWLHQLPGIKKSEVEEILLEQIESMLTEVVDDRPTARQVKKRFRAEEDALLCASCC